jgi:hypothetical protein
MKKRIAQFLMAFLCITTCASDVATSMRCGQGTHCETFFGCNDKHNDCNDKHNDHSCDKCCRGKRGKRGERGRRGRNAPILLTEELFVNAPQITNQDGGTPDISFALTYGIPTVLEAWTMPFPLVTGNPAFGSQFLIPINLDRTEPVSLTLHFFNAAEDASGDVRFLVQTDYMETTEIIGISLPADGYAQTLQTGNIPVLNPAGANNLRYFTATVDLNGALMVNKTWAVVVVTRILTTNVNDFVAPVYLTGISMRYTRATT